MKYFRGVFKLSSTKSSLDGVRVKLKLIDDEADKGTFWSSTISELLAYFKALCIIDLVIFKRKSAKT